jgi:2,4-didehydro-3-deoxy-L-rhamnonate hydrolase
MVNASGRASLLVGDQVFDLEEISGGAVPPEPMAVIADHWDAALKLAEEGATSGGRPLADVQLGPPVPAPRAVFAIGLNYRRHAEESGMDLPQLPAVFTKFPTSVVGPFDDVVLPFGERSVDWEAELAFVVGRGGRRIRPDEALSRLAGFVAAQDVSERRVQMAAGGQFSMGKSFDTFCPIGPSLVTLDELDDPLDLPIRCRVNGAIVQDARTSDMVKDVPRLVEFLSSVLTLRPGDVCLTGTPPGVGMARNPPVYLKDGDVVETEIEGVGLMRNRCVAEEVST